MKRTFTMKEKGIIFRRYQFGEETQTAIAKDYGVAPSTISSNLKWFAMEAVSDYISNNHSIEQVAVARGLTVGEAKMLINNGFVRLHTTNKC